MTQRDSNARTEHHYTHGHGAAQNVHAARTAQDSAAFLVPHLTANTQLLDIGCGPGSITLDLADHIESLGGSSDQVTGIDISQDAISAATALAAERQSNVIFTQSNANALPFPDNTFDVVYAAQVLHHLPDPVATLKEWARVVKPGGIIASREVDYGAMTWYPPNPGLSRWRAIFSVISDLADTQPNAGRHLPTWFHTAGIDNLQISSSNWTYGTQQQREKLADSWIQRVQENHYQTHAATALGDLHTHSLNDFAPEGTSNNPQGHPAVEQTRTPGATTHAAITQIIEGWTTWKNTTGALFIMPHVEVVATVASV